ncbi:NADP-dependent oxidoreductase domain-containing protein [Mycena galopus ATCC 62051]|nr:NADP-dependent oxidoreductase domain-containing protein [Mycena galopus ATCC 62051]
MAKTLSIPLVLGAGALGLEGATHARITGKTAGQDLVDAFLKTGGNTIDTAAVYAGGTLFPLLKKLNIRFYGYSPLAGGILAGKDLGVATKDGSRFHSGTVGPSAQTLLDRYALLVPPAQELRDEAAKHGLSLPQVTFRWLQHHSKLEGSKGDAIVIGAFTLERLQQTQEWNEEGPLPDDIVKLVDALFQKNKGLLVNYSVT